MPAELKIQKMKSIEKSLKRLYTSPSKPSAFGGAHKLIQAAAKNNVSKNDVKKWLSGQDSYTMHKKVIRRFPRRKYILLGIDDLWQADLADMNQLKTENDGISYWLVVIDTFSKFVWLKAIKDKRGTTVTSAFAAIVVESQRSPKNLNTDKGTEFVNATFSQFMKKMKINFYTAENPDTKACFAERVIRTIKEKLFRYMTHNNTNRYIDALQDIVTSYNYSVHGSTKMKPAEVNADNEDIVRQQLSAKRDKDRKSASKFKSSETVKLATAKGPFRKGYESAWTEEIFRIADCFATNPPTYQLEDLAGEKIVGRFYAEELQRASLKTQYKIERILRTRKRKGFAAESLVKWMGYPLSMSSWVPTSDINDI